MTTLIYSPEGATISKGFYEIQRLIMQHDKMEASYQEILPKVCSNLVHDLLLRLKEDPGYPPMYTVEVFTKKGTDSQLCREPYIEYHWYGSCNIRSWYSLRNTYEIDS
jgi:hypothetical protein